MKDYRDVFLKILFDKEKRKGHIKGFQESVWNIEDNSELTNFLKELAYDLDYYESKDELRSEDDTYYGDSKLESEIEGALEKLKHFENIKSGL